MILCIGTTPTAQRSMTFDHLKIDEVNRAKEVSEYASGKSINVARVLQTLGQSPLCTGFLGGPRGEMIRQDLDAAGIQHDFVQVTPPTRLCTTVINRADQTATELVEESAQVEPTAWPSLDAKIQSLGHTHSAKVWVLSGSLPPHANPHAYSRWAAMGLAAGARVILDARGEPVRHALCHQGLVVKLNRHELADTVQAAISDEASLKEAMRQALPLKGVIIVTLGKDGALATEDGQRFWRARAPVISVVSAVGSGDAFAAGLAAGFYDSLALPDALKLAAACGSANALTDRAGHLTPGDLAHLLPSTMVSLA